MYTKLILLTLSILLGVFCILSRCSSICVSKSSTAALSTVTSSLSGERERKEGEKGRQRGGEGERVGGGGGREGVEGRGEERKRERGREGEIILQQLVYKATCTLALTSELPKDTRIKYLQIMPLIVGKKKKNEWERLIQ